MTKDEFLNSLQEALSDSVPPDTVRENIQYYRDYINEEESKGRSEAEVLDELGSPRLIAHTIKDTTPEAYSYSAGQGGSYGNSSSARNDYQNGRQSYHSFDIDLGKWYWKIILFVILFAVIIVVITVISGFMTLLLPVLPIVFVVAMMMMMFGGHR